METKSQISAASRPVSQATASRQGAWNRLGNLLSGLGLVHCLLVPVLLLVRLGSALFGTVHEAAHPIPAVVLLPVTFVCSALEVEEDSATRVTATALARNLGTLDPTASGSLRWVVEQGFEMGQPGLLEVEADKLDDEIVAIRVGGFSVLVSESIMEIPNV